MRDECTIKNLFMSRQAVESSHWEINENGEPIELIEADTPTNYYFRAYECDNCFRSFSNWKKAEEHLKRAKQGTEQ